MTDLAPTKKAIATATFNDADGDGVRRIRITGCQDEAACNYDADATDDDGSCLR